MNPVNLYYDYNGKPMTASSYNTAMKAGNTVARTSRWFGRVRIVTKWDGFAMTHKPHERPLIFTTYVYVKGECVEQDAYATVDDAILGHRKLAKQYRNPFKLAPMVD